MDLIEVLWKQDVDLGFSLDVANGKGDKPEADLQNDSPSSSISMENDDVEKLKTLKAINEDSIKVSFYLFFFNINLLINFSNVTGRT
jgi:hypothetical protein